MVFRKINNYVSFQKQPLLLQAVHFLFIHDTKAPRQKCHFDTCCWSLDLFLLLIIALLFYHHSVIILLLITKTTASVFPKIHLLLNYLLLSYQTQCHNKGRKTSLMWENGEGLCSERSLFSIFLHDPVWCLPPIGGRTTWHAISQEHDRCKGVLEMGHNRLTMNESQVRPVNCQELCV